MPGEMYIESVEKQEIDLTSVTGRLKDVLGKLDAFVVFQGETTGPGLPDGSSLLCTDLSEKADYDGNQVVITSGPYAGQARDIDGATDDGILNPHLPFGGQIDTGTRFAILALRTVPAEVAELAGKLSGEPPVSGSTTANWNSGTGTSGETGGDVVTIGSAGTKYKLHSLIVDISALTGTEIHVKLFMKVNGVERKVYDETFDATSDPPGLWIVNGTVGIHEALRVELQSNAGGDDGKAVSGDYMLEAM